MKECVGINMSVYNCDICDGCFCCDENPCHESSISEFGLVCDDCATECGCSVCDQYDASLKYCKITDQYFHDKCMGI
jgi:hypothetical protein